MERVFESADPPHEVGDLIQQAKASAWTGLNELSETGVRAVSFVDSLT